MNIYSSSLTWVADYQFIPGLKAAGSKRKWKWGPVLFKKELFRQVGYNLQSWYLKAVSRGKYNFDDSGLIRDNKLLDLVDRQRQSSWWELKLLVKCVICHHYLAQQPKTSDWYRVLIQL